ncbi:DMT family transporter [Actinomadura sp. NEAU-AAG7]|uniref:DMT family transporter n=1 Tax=Actinomadura sp. NEAU-AAG7 TaxID=2839640 RepID=UPI001BE415FE|nr:DMT family transporter [Actinomadura sp. NEAU-AAG7]MBT2207049.1 DMT family transporter [Actinomadura sp. NEAU-AAG7]
MGVLFLVSALVIGGLLAVQASANLQLNRVVGTPYGASTLQLGIAAVLLAAVAGVAGGWGALAGVADVAPWKLLGGVASPIYIASAILLFPRLGALASAGLFVAGQVLASLVLDIGGLLGVEQRSFNAGMALGALAVLGGIAVVIRSQLAGTSSQASSARAGWIALGLLAGAVLPVQGAINAALRVELDDAFAVGMVSFTVATATIAVVLVLLLALRRTPRPQLNSLNTVPWWGWLGGAAAATYVTLTFLLIPRIGAATTIALTVTGQQLTAAAIDHYGLFRLPPRPVTVARLAGLASLGAGCALVQLA